MSVHTCRYLGSILEYQSGVASFHILEEHIEIGLLVGF